MAFQQQQSLTYCEDFTKNLAGTVQELAGDTSSTHLHWSAVVPKKGPWSARPHLAAPLLFAGRENHDLKSSDIKAGLFLTFNHVQKS